MEFLEANQLHRKYGVWGTHHSLPTEITPLATIGFLEVQEKSRLIIWVSSGETEHFVVDRGYLLGWPAFGAAIGAGTTMLYAWLYSRAMRKT